MGNVESWHKRDENGRSRAADALESPDPKVVTRELKRRLHGRFGQSHAVLFEVPVDVTAQADETGVTRRRIDAVAVGLQRSTDYLVHGFEIKASRGDLANDLRDNYVKSAPARRVCDRWWLVVPRLSLFLPHWEWPPGWGILFAAERGLHVAVKPEPLDTERDPGFTAKLVQVALRSHGLCMGLARSDGYRAGYKRGLAEGEEIGRDKAAMERLQRRVTREGDDAA